MPISAALLDLDGTLLDTIPDLADAANGMLAELGHPALSQQAVAMHVGRGTRALITDILAMNSPQCDDRALDDALASFRRHYLHTNGRGATLYPGVLDGLQRLRRMGLKLAVVTNKPTEFTLPLLAHSGLAPYFQHVVCGDTCPEQKPLPMPLLHACTLLDVAPPQTVMIGDSINDVQAAQAAGITALAVPYGYNHGHGVQNLKANDIVMSIDAAAQWISARKTN